ncbi:MAG TPA: cation diffusion facilitator family transporter [Gemmatimonadaceae bacterium]|nr:cation diffusion facilitator family transporter [Gemmatimonadaceae bacterium]
MTAHHHHHHDGHSHDHAHGADAGTRRLIIALGLTALFLVVEVIGGILAHSLTLLADAGHMFTDVAALGLSLFVAWFSRQPGTPEKTYGYLRWEILAAFLNGSTLLVVSAGIIYEAIVRLGSPTVVQSNLMLGVAAASVVTNLISAYVLHGGAGESLNMRGAYLHVLGDLLGGLGAVAAALIIRFTGWQQADPIASIVMTVLIVRGSWRIVRESVDILLEATPSHISVGAVRAQLLALPGIESVHDLHVWTVTSGVVAMSAHALVRDPERQQHALEHIIDAMRLFGIEHVTVQIESREMAEREAHLHA